MKTVTRNITTWLQCRMVDSGDDEYTIHPCDMSDYGYVTVSVMETPISMNVPDDFCPVNSRVDALKEEKSKISAEAQVKCQNLEDQIQALLCIEHKESE